MTIETLTELLQSHVLRYGTERQLQDDVERVLTAHGIDYRREYPLGNDAIDFFVQGVGIECKTQGGPSAVLEQLVRYAEQDDVQALILLTSRRTLRFDETEIMVKPFAVVWVAAHL